MEMQEILLNSGQGRCNKKGGGDNIPAASQAYYGTFS